MGMTLVGGRDFDYYDAKDVPPVVIVNQEMVRRYWPAGALGQRITIRGQLPAASIVGIVSDVRHFGVESKAQPEMYVPHAQASMSKMTVVIRTLGDPSGFIPSIKDQVRAVDPNLAVSRVRTMEDVLGASTAPRSSWPSSAWSWLTTITTSVNAK